MWVLLTRFGGFLLGGLVGIIPTIVGQVLIAAGIGVVTYSGVDVALGWLKDLFITNITAMPPQVLGLLSLMKVGVCVSMVISATAIRLGINGMNSGIIKSWVKR